MIKLRPYQQDMIDGARNALAKHQRILLQAPTGAGKTALACHMMHEAQKRGLSSFFLVHQNELLKQTSRALWANKIEHGMIAAGRGRSPLSVQVASVMTLKNRLDAYDPPSLVIVDESHRALAPSYLAIAEAYPNAKMVGLTATPRRTDGRGLGHLFQEIVNGPSIRSLIDMGYLCDYELFGVPSAVNVDHVKTKGGDYDTRELSEAVNKPKITGDAVDHYKRFAMGEKAVVMCVDIAHAEAVAKSFNDQGVKAEAIHGGSTDRDGILDRFESGSTDVITSVQLLVEGVDIPCISVIIWLRPTQSLVVWLQGNGRGLRPHESKSFLKIFDHVGNWARHGLPDREHEWDLADKQKGKRNKTEPDVNVQVCQECHHTFLAGVRECPFCGVPVKFRERVLEVVDGELERIRAAQAEAERKKENRREQGQARSLYDLVRIGVSRSMKNPAFWAATVSASREHRKPTQSEIQQARKIQRELSA